MRPKTLMLLALALGCGLVASIGISQMIENRHATPVIEKEPIFVASKDIKINEPFSEQNLHIEDWPKDRIPADAIRDPKDFATHRAGTSILPGEPLRKAKFAQDKRVDQIPPGYRVVAVGADAVSAIGNLLQPGDRIDVLMFLDANGRSNVEHSVTRTILQDIAVFAVNEQYQPSDTKNSEVITAKTVELLVTPEQAEKLTQATEMGKIRLVLRHPDDDKVADTQGIDALELLGGPSLGDRHKEFQTARTAKTEGGPTAAAPAPAAEPSEHFYINMVKGGELSLVDMTRRPDGQWVVAEPKVIVAADPHPAESSAAPAPAAPAASNPTPTPSLPALPISLPKSP